MSNNLNEIGPLGYHRMNPEFKAKWVAALRSGDYKQGRGTLKDAKGCYCCLGVAVSVMLTDDMPLPDGCTINVTDHDFYSINIMHVDEGRTHELRGSLPSSIRNMIGLYECNSSEVSEGLEDVESFLINRNDAYVFNDGSNAPWSFEEIADWIEENL